MCPNLLESKNIGPGLCQHLIVHQNQCWPTLLVWFFYQLLWGGGPLKLGLPTAKDTLVFFFMQSCLDNCFQRFPTADSRSSLKECTSIGSGKIRDKKRDFKEIPFRISGSGKRDLFSVASLEQWLVVSYCIKINHLFILSIKSLTTPCSWHVFLIDENS